MMRLRGCTTQSVDGELVTCEKCIIQKCARRFDLPGVFDSALWRAA